MDDHIGHDQVLKQPTPQTDENVSPRTPVRIKVYGGGRSLLTPGTDWRVERVTEHIAAGGLIGEVMPEWAIIDLQPVEAAAPALDVDRAVIEEAKAHIQRLMEDVPSWKPSWYGAKDWLRDLPARLSDSDGDTR